MEARLFRQYFEIAPDGIVLLDNEDRVLKANPAFLSMFGYRLDEVRGRTISELIVDEAFQPEARAISLKALSAQIEPQEALRCRKNGELLHVEIFGMPVSIGEHRIGIYAVYRDVTARRQAEDLLAQSEEKYRSIVESLEDGYFEVDLAGNLLFFNAALGRILGRTPEQLKGLNNRDYMDEATARKVYQAFSEVHDSGQPNPGFSWQFRLPGGELRYMETSVGLVRSGNGQPAGFRGILRDVTDRIRTLDELFNAKELAEITLGAIADGVIRIDRHGRIDYLNPSARRLLDVEDDYLTGLPVEQVVSLEDGQQAARDMISRCLGGEKIILNDGTALLRSASGAFRTIELSISPVRNAKQRIVGAVLAFSDISEQVRIREQLAYQARHDALTGLANRYRFEDETGRLIESARQEGAQHCLLYMDLDQFKVVNDTCGHHAGDQLLRRLSILIKDQVRRDDLLARLGGDEFGLLLSHCDTERAGIIAAQIIASVNQFEFEWKQQTFSVGISIGVVSINEHASLSSLLQAADQACYAAKDQGRNRFQVYRSDDDELIRRSTELRAAAFIDAAIRENRFELHFQRIVNIQDPSAPSHREILLRMRGRDGRLVAPAQFIPGAERYGKVTALDRWVVENVFAMLVRLKAEGRLDTHERYSVNLAGSTLNDTGFQAYLKQLIADTGIAPDTICFEITESSAVTNFRSTARFLQNLRKLGCHIMLDDFGSGLSSFTYLKMLPIDYLKIDGALIRDIARSDFDVAILQAIRDVARAIDVPLVAERVEDEATLSKLREIGVDYAQGFHLHRPEPCQPTEASDQPTPVT